MSGTCVIERLDYLPFGAMAPTSASVERQGITDCGVATYGGEPDLTVEFTGKERDAETGFDYLGARYFSGAQGRFTSPDPLIASAKLEDPQTWNRYVYARNNPLRYTDPLGLYPSPAYNCSDQNSSCLNDEQRRILENSQVKVGIKPFLEKRSGMLSALKRMERRSRTPSLTSLTDWLQLTWETETR